MKRKFPVKILSLHCAIAFATMGGNRAMAADEVVADQGGVDEIIVTASKRKESINDVPMSITALTGDQLAEKGIESVADLQKVVTGFRYTEASPGAPIYYIRGIGFNETSLGSTPNVSVYVDEVPLAFPAMTTGAGLDLERVEVLKGPQGTLFGQNSTGGAINYIAAKPTNTFKSELTVGYGSFDDKMVNGYVNGPIAENLNARFAFKAEKSGPWQKSVSSDRELGRKDTLAGRILVDWKPIDRLKLAFNLNGNQDKSELQAGQYSGYEAINSINAGFVPAPFNNLLQNYNSVYSIDANNRSADWGARNPKQDNTLSQISARADYDLENDKQLTYIVAHAHYTQDKWIDGAGVNFTSLNSEVTGNVSSTTHELRLAGKALESKAKWMIGGNYEKSTVNQLDMLHIDNVSNAFAAAPAPIGGPQFFTTNNQSSQEFTNKAVFAAFDYDFNKSLVGHASARHTWNKDEFSGCSRDAGDGSLAAAYNAILGGPVINPGDCITLTPTGFGLFHSSLDESNTSWRAGLDWKLDDGSLIYGNISKGYKAGSFPNLSGTKSQQYAPVTQESVVAYEAGFKTNFKEQKLQLTGAVFYYDYENKQVRGRVDTGVPFGFLEALVNVPKSEVTGVELQGTWKPLPGWVASAGATYLETKILGQFDNFDDFGNPSTSGAPRSFSGDAFPNTPKLMGNADLQYAWALADGKSAFVGGSVQYQDRTYNGFGEDPREKIDAYSTVDLRAGLDAADGSWRATIWGRNIFDKYYWFNQTRAGDTIVRITGQPRTVGATLTYRFK